MKLEKVYGMILKERLKEAKEGKTSVSLARLGDKTAAIMEHVAFLLPECLLDLDKFTRAGMAERLFREAETGYDPVERVGAERKVKSRLTRGTLTLRELEAGDVRVRVQSKYLRCFEHPECRVKAPLKPVFVYEGGELRGMILPARCAEEDWERGEWIREKEA